MVMTAHILLPQIDAKNPATLSRQILTELLRKEMRFNGVVLADDLGMGAIRERLAPGDAAVATFSAGVDMAMLCHDWTTVEPALKAVAAAVENHVFPQDEWDASHLRIEELRRRIKAQPRKQPLSVAGCAEHQHLANKIRASVKYKAQR